MQELQFTYRIELLSTYWDEAETLQEVSHGTRSHQGNDASASAAARRTRTSATAARISRTGVIGHGAYTMPQDAHLTRPFTIELKG